jgi:acetolactate synthase-1/2/3 large subunit
MPSGHRYLAEALAACGIRHFFHMPLVLPEAIKQMQSLGVQPVVTHSEKAAAYMADGYARASGRLGVCACQAIGAANLAAGVLDAWMARSPVLALSGGGTASTRDRNNYQEVDQRPIWSGLTKMSARVDNAARLPDLLGQAIRSATSGVPGPVHLELGGFTGGVLGGEAGGAPLPDPRFALCPSVRHAAPAESVEEAARLLAEAQRPVVVAGSGIRASGAGAALEALVRRLGLPLAVSLDSKAVLADDDPLSAGVVGTYSRDSANRIVSEADLVLFAATTTGSMVTAGWTVPEPGVRAIQIDVDPRELGRNYPLDCALAGDPATILEQLSDAATEQRDRSAWLERVAELRAAWDGQAAALESDDATPLRPERLAALLSLALPDQAILIVDTGHIAGWTARHVRLRRGQRLLRPAGSMGWGFPAAIGAACAVPDRPVVCFTGDGGFLYHLAELETAQRYRIPLVSVISNNNGYSQERPVWNESADYDHNWRFAPVSYTDVARSFGCPSWRVEQAGDFEPAFSEALAVPGPAIVEVMTDERVTLSPPWTPSAAAAGG